MCQKHRDRDKKPKSHLKLPSTRSRFVCQLAAALRGRCEITEGSRLIVATSGGADSIALLAGLAALAQKPHWRLDLTVAHINHHLRNEADQEAAFVENIAAQLDLPYELRDISLGSKKQTNGYSELARKSRYAALKKIAINMNADSIVTGHHGTDQLETVLLSLLRGSGLRGMSGMAWRTSIYGATIIRPLLDQTHQDCINMCREIGWQWCEDASNAKTDQKRNRLRIDVLSRLLDMEPGLDGRIHRLTDVLTGATDLVDAEVARWFGFGVGCELTQNECEFARDELRNAPAVVLGAGLRSCAASLGSPKDRLSFEVVGSVVDAILDSDRHPRVFHWPGGIQVRVTSKDVVLESEQTDHIECSEE